MAEILSNQRLSRDFYLMETAFPNTTGMGQFYMLRAWKEYPILSRPISAFDAGPDKVSFLYKTVGTGTEIFSRLRPGDEITLQGPLGNTFPEVSGSIAMVGGGVGIAPFNLAARRIKAASPESRIDLYLGFSDEAVLVDQFSAAADTVTVNVGGFITDEIDPSRYDYVFTCGPEIMMKVLFEKCRASGCGDKLYVSMENRMACGIGACLVCSCRTVHGNRKACKDGPVFRAAEVFGL
ncbi:dihydroorotate dehydrogenase electron transfer subunit [Breznakiella homolactica]|uniref:Dihydroorotate dehydrogenase electron transfer subunit n=1 Tax=Breznakiella homolactica TaxID=2798577 RepID=A0A7T7XQB6_9SPIR|nr:dihydroorotate dehydrogenase electron transfer subunit [Breznakiella homolactica]QQO10561.1 dihydroorotate dehydrogenase electron transfer subunit [Breznakiella homolactica]